MTHGVHSSRIPSHWIGLAALLAAAIVMAVAASPAQAGKGWRFKETFGSANQPTFSTGGGNTGRTTLAVDDTGRLYVFNHVSPETLSRWNPDGTPANFAALGTNVIDGAAGGLDATPQGFIGGWFNDQVAIDNSGGVNDGNIYLGDANNNVVNIFAADGTFLGQLTGTGEGVTVDDEGAIYASGFHVVKKYEPAAKPPIDADNTASFPIGGPSQVAAGDGPTDGYIFVATDSGIKKMDVESGAIDYTVTTRSFRAVAVEPVTGNVFGFDEGNEATHFAEYDASGSIEATVFAHVEDTGGGFVQGVAPFDGGESLYFHRGGLTKVQIWEAGPTPTTVTGDPAEVLGARATVTGTVDPEGTEVRDCFFEYGQRTTYGQQAPCQQYLEGGVWRPLTSPSDLGTGTDPVPVRGEISGLLANEVPHHYQLVAVGDFGRAPGGNETLTTAETYFTGPASNFTETGATLNGTVKLEGVALTECTFQWGLTRELGERKDCDQAPGSILTDDNDHSVTAALSGLNSSTIYYYRLAVRNSAGQIHGAIHRFGTKGLPGIEGQMASALGERTATLQALVNPFGSQTDYHFEWGTDTNYGNRVPATGELDAGSGDLPVLVSADLSNLDPQTTYYFRVVADNNFGPSEGPDHPFQTLNEHGLPDNRAFELVTPASKGPAGSLVASGLDGQPTTLGAQDGNCVFWPLQNAMPESTVGGWTRWLACRDADQGWSSRQVSAPARVAPSEYDNLGFALPSRTGYNSENLDCGTVETYNPLTPDTPELSVELGVSNLYLWRRGPDGQISYELITDRVPLNPGLDLGGNAYGVVGAAEDCSHVYFLSVYELIGGSSGFYVWEEGPDGRTLYDAALLPDRSPAASASMGSDYDGVRPEVTHSVSPGGELFFFTATANGGPSAGKRAVFMRDASDGSVTEVSRSQTAVVNNGARLQAVSADGRRVFFLANYGIADETSDGPTGENCESWSSRRDSNPSIEQKACDLYAYEVETGELTSLSADANPADAGIGAQVQGAVGFSESGSHAYFAALGQLLPGQGRTHAENVATRSANVYLTSPAGLAYVANLRRDNGELFFGAVMGDSTRQTAEMSADGKELLFEAISKQNWYDGGGGRVAYLYSAETGEIACVSCRPDGEPTTAGSGQHLIGSPLNRQMSADGSRVFFISPDALMPGAEAGKNNIYEWHRGQLYFLAIADVGSDATILGQIRGLHDVSADGRVAFISTGHRLVTQDHDALSDVYAVRVDGGIDPPPVIDICDPLSGGSCEGQGSSSPGAADVATPSFEGAPNPAPRWAKSCPRGKRKVTRNGKTRCVRKQVRKKGKRAANKTRRASR